MFSTARPADNPAMDHEKLFSDAVRLAYEAFVEPSDSHITGVYAIVVWHAQRGLAVGWLTVH